jgi:hypothetical protein
MSPDIPAKRIIFSQKPSSQDPDLPHILIVFLLYLADPEIFLGCFFT